MKIQYILPIILVYLFSCNLKPAKPKKVYVQSDLDSALCTNSPLSNNKECPDSVEIFEFDDLDLQLVRSNYSYGIYYYLIQFNSDTLQFLDSILCFSEGMAKPENLTYDFSNDWFMTASESGGTNHYSLLKTLNRINENRFVSLFEYYTYWSMIDPETTPREVIEIENEIKRRNKDSIIIVSYCKQGILTPDDETKYQHISKDSAVFVFNKSAQKFEWKWSSNPKFENYWIGDDIGYPDLLW